DRIAKAITPLGDTLILESLSGHEELSRIFRYELVLVSEDWTVQPSSLLGQNITVELQLEGDETRHFNGIVSRFARGGSRGRHAAYHLELRPWFWLLTHSVDCRIFQSMTVPDVIMQVFRDFGLTDFDNVLAGDYRTWDYLVQYRETTADFISRLMEQEGIYYFFRHESGKHVLVLADGYTAHEPAPAYEQVPYFPPDQGHLRERDHLTNWTASEQVQSASYTLNDFDFVRPKASLITRAADPAERSWAAMEVYEYPGEYVQDGEGESYAKTRMETLLAQYERVEGRGNARGLRAGQLFSLTGFPIADQNREYLIVSAEYSVENNALESAQTSDARVRAKIEAIPSRTQYRPRALTPRPIISGPQTAIVVGKAGEEIWTDQYGRVKVQFHWDRLGKSDENSSCWVRVAQIWAGNRWGGIHIPRIGQEVIVEFLEGDPDRPIITGRVYNGDNRPPYDLPSNQTQSGIKSRSSQNGTPQNFNELRFEDKKDREQVFLHAEKDMSEVVKNDHSTSVGANQTNSITKNHTETVGGDQSLSVTGTRKVQVTGSQSVNIDGSRALDGVSGSKLNITGDYKVDASNTITVQAPTSIKFECGGSMVLIEPSKITISAGGQANIVLDANAFIGSSQGTQMLLDANALIQASQSANLLLDANALMQSSAGAKLLLDANATAQSVAGAELKLDANATMSGVEATVSGQVSAQLDAVGNVKADPSGVTVQGTMVKIN
ncbi:MAG: type secretion system tip protein VgrG, partial [Pseudomonadota bacterium]